MSDRDKPALIYLCHRIPYPPNKGDKIRSCHLLRFLSERYRLYLGAFVDDADDWQYRPVLEELCEEVFLLPLSPRWATIKSLSGMAFGEALSIPYYRNVSMSRWVDSVVHQQNIERAVVFSSTMAQYLMDNPCLPERRVLDLVDVDSDKWRQYAARKPWPLSWLYRREAKCLLHYERHMAEEFDFSFFVSEPEADHFLQSHPEGRHKVGYYNNGVDSDFFDPSRDYINPYHPNVKVLAFTGAMDYWPNVDAVMWFAHEVLPRLREQDSQLQFYVVGRNPNRQVMNLADCDGVTVTGSVDDIRPYLFHAFAVVAPMRIARGVQNKVLEAMAMEKTVVVSSMGLEGIHAQTGVDVLLADSAQEMTQAIHQLTDESRNSIGKAARRLVYREFSWETTLPRVIERLEQPREAVCV